MIDDLLPEQVVIHTELMSERHRPHQAKSIITGSCRTDFRHL